MTLSLRNSATEQTQNTLEELDFERTIGGLGSETDRKIPLIDLGDFETRRDEISRELWQAASEVGFFQLVNHGLETEEIRQAFRLSERFFQLPEQEKNRYALKKGQNAGWEFKSQVRPSTQTADQKESFQVTLPRMEGLWPDQVTLAEFQRIILDFEYKAWRLGMQVLSCFAEKLDFPRDFFALAHDRASEEYQSTLRLLHYLPLSKEALQDASLWRAGAHTDFDCLTMVFQREGQGGLQVCPGQDANKDGNGPAWTSVEPRDDIITCNIGDMLMRWSDDQLKSTLHRVRMPTPEEAGQPRYSMAFFCQANKSVTIQGPNGKYPPITAHDYLQQRIAANFSAEKKSD
ncbi:isopenicillin N synthase family dioxygenase [Halomonas sp. GD1P12]|uniref:isopenicillin N synthase family dioxygenase n=1 Tax=Halomonas sp. GD1P12 TaxID=2982691 RepID=UPI0021E3EEFC|nr:2-oxoglutarate and iron-dependent oxygenase domain-containing protein [Halomonas sp. GD1P12]UYF99770.1 isopenicillin N synthase family oxygenase [Halomonas sp. GD1P12]